MQGKISQKTAENLGIETFSKENVSSTPYTNKGVTKDKTTFIDVNKSDVISDVKKVDVADYNPQENGYKIDWLSFSFPSDQLNDVLNDVMIDKFHYDINVFEKGKGRNFYNTGLTLGGYVNIYYNDVNEAVYGYSTNTANIVFTGQGMTDVVNRVGDTLEVLKTVFSIKDVSIARVDIAFDNFFKDSEVPSLELISSKLDSKEYRSPKRSHNIIKESDTEGNDLGHTIYLGKHTKTSAGNYYLRVYNKYGQYTNQKMAILPSIAEQTGCWERWEFVFTKAKAHNIVNSLLNEPRYQNDVDIIFKEMLNTTVQFIEPTLTNSGNEASRKRWKVCEWWTAFLTSPIKYKFKNSDVDADFERMLIWLSNAVAPTIKTLSIICENYGYDFFDLLQNFPFKDELSKKHIRAINDDKLNQDRVNNLISLFVNGNLIIKKGDESDEDI